MRTHVHRSPTCIPAFFMRTMLNRETILTVASELDRLMEQHPTGFVFHYAWMAKAGLDGLAGQKAIPKWEEAEEAPPKRVTKPRWE